MESSAWRLRRSVVSDSRASDEVVPDPFRETAPRLLDDFVKGGEVVDVLVGYWVILLYKWMSRRGAGEG